MKRTRHPQAHESFFEFRKKLNVSHCGIIQVYIEKLGYEGLPIERIHRNKLNVSHCDIIQVYIEELGYKNLDIELYWSHGRHSFDCINLQIRTFESHGLTSRTYIYFIECASLYDFNDYDICIVEYKNKKCELVDNETWYDCVALEYFDNKQCEEDYDQLINSRCIKKLGNKYRQIDHFNEYQTIIKNWIK